MTLSKILLSVLCVCLSMTVEGQVKCNENCNPAKMHASRMYPGWNLGNTLEAIGEGLAAETSWQNTRTTRDIIGFVKRQGFQSVRIPCSWDIHSDAQGKIDEEWLARVKEIVDDCIREGLYVVLNDHWDNGWIEVKGFSKNDQSFEKVDEQIIQAKIARLKDLWMQLATAFKGYDEQLLFAGLNEPFQQYNLFHDKHQELTPILLRYNQAFVDAVRAAGGKNKNRILVVQAPSVNISSAVSEEVGFSMPVDPVGKGRLMVEVHYYEPWDFCGQEEGGKWFWGHGNHVPGDTHNCEWGEENWSASLFAAMKKKFYDQGFPVIMGEYGANWREVGPLQMAHDTSIKAWFKDITGKAVSNGCVPMLWDINFTNRNGEKGTMTVIDRADLKVFSPVVMDGITEGVRSVSWPD
ncbi:MAG: glycoside hydrolase family 5 protein [Prevotella sp.]|nr:glycoside hydrolase family 5 protein [Prevotella sp.]